MRAYIICCNDSIEACVLSSESDAKEVCKEMAKKDFEKYKHHWPNFRDFSDTRYWHVHDVPVVE